MDNHDNDTYSLSPPIVSDEDGRGIAVNFDLDGLRFVTGSVILVDGSSSPGGDSGAEGRCDTGKAQAMSETTGVHETIYRYAYAYDSRDVDAIADCFVPGGRFQWRIEGGLSGGPFVGRDAIAAMSAASLDSQQDTRRHLMVNVIAAVDGDQATAKSYLCLASITAGRFAVIASGTYRDELVLTDGIWRFRERDLVMDCAF